MYRISKRFDFSASHQLTGLPEDHQCARLHGHNYSITVNLVAKDDGLNEVGFVRDYGELSIVRDLIDSYLEHRHLNDVLPFNPTAENIAKWFFETMKSALPQLASVSVKETDKTEAEYVDESVAANNLKDAGAMLDRLEGLFKSPLFAGMSRDT